MVVVPGSFIVSISNYRTYVLCCQLFLFSNVKSPIKYDLLMLNTCTMQYLCGFWALTTPDIIEVSGGDTMAQRRGSGGRPMLGTPSQEPSERLNLTIPHDLNVRLEKFCEDDERARSWVVQKALDKWLSEKGY